MVRVKHNNDACQVSDLISVEQEIPICAEFADDQWDEQFIYV